MYLHPRLDSLSDWAVVVLVLLGEGLCVLSENSDIRALEEGGRCLRVVWVIDCLHRVVTRLRVLENVWGAHPVLCEGRSCRVWNRSNELAIALGVPKVSSEVTLGSCKVVVLVLEHVYPELISREVGHDSGALCVCLGARAVEEGAAREGSRASSVNTSALDRFQGAKVTYYSGKKVVIKVVSRGVRLRY